MKTRLLSGWKTRAHVLCLAALCGVMMTGVATNAFAAQDPAAPAAEAVVETITETVAEAPAPEAAPAEAAAAEPVVEKGDVAWMLTSTLLVLLMVVPGRTWKPSARPPSALATRCCSRPPLAAAARA